MAAEDLEYDVPEEMRERFDAVFDAIATEPGYAALFPEQIRAKCGVNISGDLALIELLAAHPRIHSNLGQFRYLPQVTGITNRTELLVELRKVRPSTIDSSKP